MTEYIERRAAIEHLNVWCDGCGSAVECILTEPAADVAPVVHGRWIEKKECKWTGGDFVCYRGVMVQHNPEDFCSYGERRGGGEDD